MDIFHVAVSLMGIGFYCSAARAEDFKVEPISEPDSSQWLRRVLPLPQQIEFHGKMVLPVRRLEIVLPDDPSDLIRAASEELSAAFKERCGVQPAVVNRSGGDKFSIFFKKSADHLAALPNSEQAYEIAPVDFDGTRCTGLVLSALDDRGLYYAAKTLKQLMESKIRSDDATVEVPVVSVTDWPDIGERGLWGGDSDEDIPWMAERKFNLVEAHVKLSVGEDGRGKAEISPELLKTARLHAVKLVPIIHHLEQLEQTRIFDRFPDLLGQVDPETAKNCPFNKPVCWSKPQAQRIMDDWMVDVAKMPGITDVSVWLTEHDMGCICSECAKTNLFIQEVRICEHAWREARKINPELRLRLLLTQASYASNRQILAEISDDTDLSYYHGELTYDSSRKPMIPDYLKLFARSGRWLGVYPQLTASWRIVTPFSSARFIRARMQEFDMKGLQNVCGYATPSNRFYEFNLNAAAEYSWNPTGRTERVLCESYAAREGLADPDAFADWEEIMGRVGWDVYGSRVPYYWIWNLATKSVRNGFTFGEGYLSEFRSAEQLDQDIADCDRAAALAALAEKAGSQSAVLETRIVRGYLVLLRSLVAISNAPAANRGQAQEAMRVIDETAPATAKALREWAVLVAPKQMEKPPSRFEDTVKCVEDLPGQIRLIVEEMGN